MMGEGKWPGKSAQLVEFFHVVRVPWSEIDRKSMKQFQTSFFQFLAVLAKKIWKIKSKKNPPNIMALPNPFQNTFNAPPWPSQVDPSKFGCIWTPRNDFFDGLCIELGSRAIAQFSLILLHNPAARQQWGETSVLGVDIWNLDQNVRAQCPHLLRLVWECSGGPKNNAPRKTCTSPFWSIFSAFNKSAPRPLFWAPNAPNKSTNRCCGAEEGGNTCREVESNNYFDFWLALNEWIITSPVQHAYFWVFWRFSFSVSKSLLSHATRALN